MNKQDRVNNRLTKCPECKVFVKNLRRHIRRKRCRWQHIRQGERFRIKESIKNAFR